MRDKARLASSPIVSRALEVRSKYSSLIPRPSSVTSSHVTCDTRPSASLRMLNEAGRSGSEARLYLLLVLVDRKCMKNGFVSKVLS